MFFELTLQYPQQQSIDKQVENGLYFILSHFLDYTIFPRNVMTTELIAQKKNLRFKTVLSKKDALAHFKKYNYVDCRINAFECLKEGILYKPELLFFDLDLADFKSRKSLDLALSKTLKNIKENLNTEPTILWSGNGYHVIQPIECPMPLENIQQFSKYYKPSEQFLRFAKDYLSNGKADKANYPSFNSCLLRIPGSINSKCLDNKEKRFLGNIKVKVLQSWNGYRPVITRELLYNFHTYLNQKKSIERKKQSKTNTNNDYYKYNQNYNIEWIEKLLKTSITNFRKNSASLILAPYLINIKKLSYQDSLDILVEWLHKCDLSRKLDFNPTYLVKNALNIAMKKGIPPMKFETLKNRDLNLYLKINEQKENF